MIGTDATIGKGAALADHLGLSLPRREGRDLAGACIECQSSDAFRLQINTGVAYCHSCEGRWSPLRLAEKVLGNQRDAWNALIQVGLADERHEHNGHSPKVDLLDRVAREKGIKPDDLRRYGARVEGDAVVLPAYDSSGEQCTTFSMRPGNGKGLFEKGKPAGVFLPHDENGNVRRPQPGEDWGAVEGPKDAAALAGLGWNVIGLNTSSLSVKGCRLLRGCEVTIFPDRDTAGEEGAKKTAARLHGVARHVRIVTLPAEFKASKGADVRDILRLPEGEDLLNQAIQDAVAWEPESDPQEGDGAKGPRLLALTDTGNAARFGRQHGDDVLYCFPWDKWLAWDGRCWRLDNSGDVERRAKQTIQSLLVEATQCRNDDVCKRIMEWAVKSQSANRLPALLRIARSDRVVMPEQLDAHPMLLNVANGVIDLRTGELLRHDRRHLLTKLCPVEYQPGAQCHRWEEFLDQIMDGSQSVIEYLQRALGYSLTGDVSEHVLQFVYGKGANGKSVFLNVAQAMLGSDYAMKAPSDLLMSKGSESHPTALADLFGKRFVACIEAEDGKRLAEGLVKELSGGDIIRARRMREDFWQFQPSHKLWLAANHKPTVRGADHGIWRRIRLIPFTVTIPNEAQDKQLTEKLLAELPGILAWAVRGCLEWQRNGLGEPLAVKEATAEYRDQQDVLAAFLSECCIEGQEFITRVKDLRPVYESWCKANGEHPQSQRRLGAALEDRGYKRYVNNGTCYEGFGLKAGA